MSVCGVCVGVGEVVIGVCVCVWGCQFCCS